jgi:invasion protein IalB
MGWAARLGAWGLLMAGALAASSLAASAQDTNTQADQTNQADQGNQSNQAAAAKPKQTIPWLSSCSASARSLPLECAIEQRAFVRQSGQLIAVITIRVPSDTKKPVAMIHAPLGLFLPAGITVDVDGDMAQNYPFQTCNAQGCYAGFPITDKLLGRMANGGKLNLIFQYLNKQPFTLPMSLVGFKEAYGRIK